MKKLNALECESRLEHGNVATQSDEKYLDFMF